MRLLKQNFKSIILTAILFTFTLFIVSCESNEDLGKRCEDIPLPCPGVSNYSYTACADANGVWWELNGIRYDDVNDATEAYFNLCD